MKLKLTLSQCAGKTGSPPASACFFSGSSAERWLEELARCGWAEPGTRLFLVPRSMTDLTPAGLLAVPESPVSAASAPSASAPAGLPCISIADRLFIPRDARLHPPVTDAEVRQLCGAGVTFFHPALGVVQFEDGAALRVWDLLDPPDERVEHWNCARAGDLPISLLQAIVLEQPPTLGDVFGDAAESIGTEPLQDLPAAPEEPKQSGWSSSGRGLRKLLARGLAGMLGRLPHKGSRRTWVNDLEDWSRRQLQGISQQLERLRNKELHRLLHLLQNDPESGLRHAIPMNQFAHRGLGRPGAKLGERSLEFDPGRLGGRAADCWSVPRDLQAELRRLYREMAGRELRLGRHRRAAYIYAELLGDLASAANALKQGGLFREAALLFEEHLRNPREAARCLAEGGLLGEAIERYEKLGCWLEAAELHDKLGHRAAAVAAIRRVVAERLANGDVLGAAKLVEERLHEPDEGLALLRDAWPASRQAVRCLGVLFQTLSRLGRHDAALERLAQLVRDPTPPALLPALLDVLGEQASHSPDGRVRHGAADFSRVLIAQRLQGAGPPAEEGARLMASLQRLAPEDRLLTRDTNRHLTVIRATEVKRQRAEPPPRSGRAPVALRRFQLPRPLRWLGVRAEGVWFFALGLAPHRQLLLLRGVWEGEFEALSWTCDPHGLQHGFVFEPAGDQGRRILLAPNIGPALEEKVFPAADVFFNQECRVGTPTWLPAQARPFAMGEENAWSAHVAAGEAVLSCYDHSGNLQHTIEVTAALLEKASRSSTPRLCLAPFGSGAAVALGDRLVVTNADGSIDSLNLPGQALRLCPTLRHTRQGVVVVLEQGAVLLWRGSNELIVLDRDLSAPSCAFTHGGPIVLVSGPSPHQSGGVPAGGASGLLLDVDGIRIQSLTRFEPACRNPVAVTGASVMGQFALFDASGEVLIYQTR